MSLITVGRGVKVGESDSYSVFYTLIEKVLFGAFFLFYAKKIFIFVQEY